MTNLTTVDLLLPDGKSSTALPQWLLIVFVLTSIIESLLGILGNTLVIIVISCLGKSQIVHTPHNCFIINLALSDLVLCLFTMPLNTYRSLYVYMRFPPAFCKLADSFPAINVCVSSLTIVTISIYRCLVVCYPHKKLNGRLLTFFIMISIWLLAILAASPLFIYSLSTRVYDQSLIEYVVEMICMNSYNDSCKEKHYETYRDLHVCHESWPKHGNWHLLYTIFIFFLQFILPISIICITYYQVMIKLRERKFICQNILHANQCAILSGFRYRFLIKRHNIASLRNEIRRQRRNNILLLLIVASYAISWLPFNISYTLFIYSNQYQNRSGRISIDQNLLIVFIGFLETLHSNSEEKSGGLSKYLPLRFLVCMISAIANPFLYGYFNEAFKDGLEKIFSNCCRTRQNLPLDKNDIPPMQLTYQKHKNGGLASRSGVSMGKSTEIF